jgi:hypothetical protein
MKINDYNQIDENGLAVLEIEFDDEKEINKFLKLAFKKIIKEKPQEQVEYLINYIFVKILEDFVKHKEIIE